MSNDAKSLSMTAKPFSGVKRATLRVGANQAWIARSGLLIALVLAYVVFAATAPNFFTLANQLNVLRQAAFTGIIAMGMTLVVVAGEIDLSVGAMIALTSTLVGILSQEMGVSIYLSTALVIAAGTLIGLGAGFARAKLNMPSIITTLALFLALRGLAEYITNASPIALSEPFYDDVLAGSLLGIPAPAVVLVVVYVVAWFLSKQTVFGRQVYAVGGNPNAARLAGLPIDRIRVLIFGGTGFLAAVTGVLLTARIGSATSSIGVGTEFEVIAAVIIGGTRLSGGRGSVNGTMIGVLFISILGNALVLYGVNSYAQNVMRGIIVFLAVLSSNIQSGEIKKQN
jgi:ribose/xylose/arabinose/galactoside ABC-type transport system permease subunit